MLRAGQEYEHKGIKVKLREVLPYFDAAGRKSYMISYRLVDGTFESQTTHFFMHRADDIRNKVAEAVETYLEVSKIVRVGTP